MIFREECAGDLDVWGYGRLEEWQAGGDVYSC